MELDCDKEYRTGVLHGVITALVVVASLLLTVLGVMVYA